MFLHFVTLQSNNSCLSSSPGVFPYCNFPACQVRTFVNWDLEYPRFPDCDDLPRKQAVSSKSIG